MSRRAAKAMLLLRVVALARRLIGVVVPAAHVHDHVSDLFSTASVLVMLSTALPRMWTLARRGEELAKLVPAGGP